MEGGSFGVPGPLNSLRSFATEYKAFDGLFLTNPQSPLGYKSSTVLADLDHHNRRGGDLLDVSDRAGSKGKKPKGKKTAD